MLLVLLLLPACHRIPAVSRMDLSYRYQAGPEHVQAIRSVVYHSSDSSATVYLRIRQDLVAGRMPSSGTEALPRLRYHLQPGYEDARLIDSGSLSLPWPSGEATAAWSTMELQLPVARGEKALCLLRIDGEPELRHLCLIDRSRAWSAQDFLLTDPSGQPLFDPIIGSGQSFRLAVSSPSLARIFADRFQPEASVAWPPFAYHREPSQQLKADSSWDIPLDAGVSAILRLDKAGTYLFRAFRESSGGLSLLRFHESYPVVNRAEQMLPPLQYLTTSREFGLLQAEPEPKLAVDRFWLEVTGDAGRARLRIREFYSRVEESNHWFTSYKEGWKTDRGIIYIIYGPPRLVHRTDNTEKWIYGEDGNAHSLRFTFTHHDNPFSPEDYRLIRSPLYKESWYNAVEAWRR